MTASIRAGRVRSRDEALAIPCGVLRSAASPGFCGVRLAGSGASGLLMMPLPAGHLALIPPLSGEDKKRDCFALVLFRFDCQTAGMRHRPYSLLAPGRPSPFPSPSKMRGWRADRRNHSQRTVADARRLSARHPDNASGLICGGSPYGAGPRFQASNRAPPVSELLAPGPCAGGRGPAPPGG